MRDFAAADGRARDRPRRRRRRPGPPGGGRARPRRLDRRYLARIAEHHAGGPVGVETLAAALAEARDAVEDVIEPFLIQQGLILRTSRGRMLGDPGWQHLGLTPPPQPA